MSTTETAPQKQGGCNRIKTVLQRESGEEWRAGSNVGIEKEKERERKKSDKERDRRARIGVRNQLLVA